MSTRHFLIATAVFSVMVPALAQDSAPSVTHTLRATGAYPARQAVSQWLGSNLIGARVVSASNETIGRIANLLVNDDGVVESVVISIGGVFGIGKKDVAVTYKSLIIARTHDGAAIDHIVVAANKKDLSQAADFKTLSQQKTEMAARRPAQDAPTGPARVKFTPAQ
jgi:PRC-barrel domain protein